MINEKKEYTNHLNCISCILFQWMCTPLVRKAAFVHLLPGASNIVLTFHQSLALVVSQYSSVITGNNDLTIPSLVSISYSVWVKYLFCYKDKRRVNISLTYRFWWKIKPYQRWLYLWPFPSSKLYQLPISGSRLLYCVFLCHSWL